MFIDELGEFADATSVAATAGTSIVGDVIDLGNTSNNIADGEAVFLVIECTTQMITAGSAGTIQFFLVSDALATLGGGAVASCTLHLQSLAIVTDDATALGVGIAAGTPTYLPNQGSTVLSTNARKPILFAQLPPGNYERYLGVLKTVATTECTAGAVNAFLTRDPKKYVSRPDAI